MKKKSIEAIYRRPNTLKPAIRSRSSSLSVAASGSDMVWSGPDDGHELKSDGAYFVYLCAVVDRFSRRVLSSRLSITMETAFSIDAVEEALAHFCKPDIFNTDKGSQFTSMDVTAVLKIVQSESHSTTSVGSTITSGSFIKRTKERLLKAFMTSAIDLSHLLFMLQ